MERKEIIERLNEIKRVVDSNTLEELIEAYPDAAGFSLCKESTFISIVGISSFLVNKLIKDIENVYHPSLILSRPIIRPFIIVLK